MSNKKDLQLSSNWTNIGLYGSVILLLLILPLIFLTIEKQDFHIGMLIGGIGLALLIGFIVYQFIYVCDARVSNEKLILKKKFRPAKEYTFDKIGYPTSFRFKSTKYITVEMTNNDGSIEKYLILNSYAFLSFENKDAEQTLLSLRNIGRQQSH